MPADKLQPYYDSVAQETFFTWERTSQWLPWMKMGDQEGYLFYSVTGGTVPSLESLPDYIQKDIATRIPLYAHAPKCVLEMPDETSWTYFAKHFDEYLAGDVQFPVPAPEEDFPCKIVPADIAFGQFLQ